MQLCRGKDIYLRLNSWHQRLNLAFTLASGFAEDTTATSFKNPSLQYQVLKGQTFAPDPPENMTAARCVSGSIRDTEIFIHS